MRLLIVEYDIKIASLVVKGFRLAGKVFYNGQRRQARMGCLSFVAYGKRFYQRRIAERGNWCPLLT